MEETKLNFLLMGKTGQGKSATGNTILNRRVFKTSSSVTSETKEVNNNFAHFDKYTMLMVDGPGLEDTDMDKVQDKITAAKHMDKALAMCYGGVDAFLLVIKFGNRLTEEDRDAINALRKIFGDKFIAHVIVVMTCGDSFEGAMEEQGTPDKSFHVWCSEENNSVFQELYKDCDRRFVLFNNREKDDGKKRAQVLEVAQLAERLQKDKGRYTSQCFETAKYERDKLILNMRAPQLKEEFQAKISFLVSAIEDFAARPSDDVKEKVRVRVHELRHEIGQQDQGYGVLKELMDTVTQVEENLNDAEKLVELGKELEEIRQSKKTWGQLGTVCTVIGAAFALVNPIGLAVAAGSAIVAGVRYAMLDCKEMNVKQQQKQIENKIKAVKK